jgi:hypothetical protein
MLPEKERKAQENTWILELTRRIIANMELHIQSARNQLETELGGCETTDTYLAEISIGLRPETFGLAHIYQRSPYTNPQVLQKNFTDAVDRGWLVMQGEGVYQASEHSQNYYQHLCHRVNQIYRNLRPLPLMHLERIDTLLTEVVQSIDRTEAIAYRPAFEMDRRLAPMGGSLLERICCKLSQIAAYRDDTYLNAWMDQEVNSYVWEAFSHIYKGHATNARALSEALGKYRGYDEATYMDAIQELETRGWITGVNGQYEPSEQGLTILAEVARSMSQYFFAPWAGFNSEFLTKLKYLLEALDDALKPEKTKRWYGQANIGRTYGWRSIQWARDKQK